MNPKCPQCKGRNITQTQRFDLTLVDVEEARHDFECLNCECLFQIIYHPVEVVLHERGNIEGG